MAVEQIIEGSSFTSPLLLPLITVVVALAVVHFWQQSRHDRKIGDLIPGPPTVPILGNAHFFVNLKNNEIFEKAMDIAKRLRTRHSRMDRSQVGRLLIRSSRCGADSRQSCSYRQIRRIQILQAMVGQRFAHQHWREVANSPQAHRTGFPHERPQEFHADIQRQLTLRHHAPHEGSRQGIWLSWLHERGNGWHLVRDCDGIETNQWGRGGLPLCNGRDENVRHLAQASNAGFLTIRSILHAPRNASATKEVAEHYSHDDAASKWNTFMW